MRLAGSGFMAALALAACSATQPEVQSVSNDNEHEALQAAAAQFDLGQPYLGGALLNGERLIHPPPQHGDGRMQADLEANARALSLRGSARWNQAAQDAELTSGWYHQAFACTAGRSLKAEDSPALANVVRRAASDFALSTSVVKKQFQRERPFMVNGEASCTPADEAYLRTNGSYPSGHSAIGYGTAMVLASLLPDRAAELMVRGRGYGNSRWVCNVHWFSDVEEGRAFAAATFARLQSSAEFQQDIAAARAELAASTAAFDADACAASEGNGDG